MTLSALANGKTIGVVESAALSDDATLGSAFVIYCNDLLATPIGQNSATRTLLDGYFLGQISELSSQVTDLGGTGLVLATYDRAAHLAMSFAHPSTPEDNSPDKQIAELQDSLWRLFLSGRNARPDTSPGVAVDWMMLANENSSSFDYSRWRF